MNIRFLNRDLIKLFAMFTMTCNHVAHVFLTDGTPLWTLLTIIGYFTAPTMCYFLVEGMEYTRSKEKYALRLAVFALISQFPFWYALSKAAGKPTHSFGLFTHYNMMFTLFLCSLICIIWKRYGVTQVRYRALIGLLVLISLCSDWGLMAPIYTVLILRARDLGGRKNMLRAYLCNAIILAANASDFGFVFMAGCFMIVMSAGLVLVYLYNGKRMEKGRDLLKWFFYLYYPLHLLLIALFARCLRV